MICYYQRIVGFCLRVHQKLKRRRLVFLVKRRDGSISHVFLESFLILLKLSAKHKFLAKDIIFVSILEYLRKYDLSAMLPNTK